MSHEILPFHSTLDYLVSLSQVIGARRAALSACDGAGEDCPAAEAARAAQAAHRERELLGLASGVPHRRGPLGLADRCGFHILEVRILAYLFLSEGTAPRVPVFLDVAEMARLIADPREAPRLVEFLDLDEVLVAAGLVTPLRVGSRGMVALTPAGRAAFVRGGLSADASGDSADPGDADPEADEAPGWAPRTESFTLRPPAWPGRAG